MTWEVYGRPPEVMPAFDLRDHIRGMECWCKPYMDENVIVHNSLDGREEYDKIWSTVIEKRPGRKGKPFKGDRNG